MEPAPAGHSTVRPISDSTRVLLFGALSFLCMGLPRTFTWAAAYSIFVNSYGADLLPITFLAASVLVPCLGYVFLKLERKVSFPVLLIGLLLVDVAVLALLWIGLDFAGLKWLALVAAIWFEAEWVLCSLVFWGLAERSFDILQAKRCFGRIGAGEPLAAVAGGLLVPLLLVSLTPADLFVASAVSLVASVALVGWLVRLHADRLDQQDAEHRASSGPGMDGSHGMKKYLTLAFAMVVVGNVAYFCVDMAFFLEAEGHYPDQTALASFIALVHAVVGGASFVCNSILSGWLLTRFGVRTSLLALPVVVALIGSALVAAGAVYGAPALLFWLAVVLYIINDSVRGGIYRPAFLTLFQPLPPHLRIRAQAISESVFEQVGAGLAGLILLGLTRVLGLETVGVVVFLLAVVAVWAVQAYYVHREYLRVLAQALGSRRFGQSVLSFEDPDTRKAILDKLDSVRTAEVATAIELLGTARDPALMTRLPELLRRPAPQIRMATLRLLERMPGDDALPLLERCLDEETEPALRAEAVAALGRLAQPGAIEALKRVALDPTRQERAGAIVGLVRHGDQEDVRVAGELLLKLATSVHRDDRHQAAVVLQDLHGHRFHGFLKPLLEDPHRDVRHLAIRAAGQMKAPQLRPILMAALFSKPDRNAASRALVAMGDDALPDLRSLWEGEETPLDVREAIVRVLGGIGSASATETLLGALAVNEVRSAVIEALHGARFRCTTGQKARIWPSVHGVVKEIAEVYVLRVALEGDARSMLLCDALAQLIHNHEACLFRLAGLGSDPVAMDQAWRQFSTGTSERRAYAIEMLANLVPKEIRLLVAPVLEPASPGDRARRLADAWHIEEASVEDRLLQLVTAHTWATPWVRACAIHRVACHSPGRLSQDLLAGLSEQGGIVAETAAWAANHSRGAGVLLLTVEKVLILKTVDIFESVPDEYLVEIASALELRTFRPGEAIIRQGDVGTTLFIIVSGLVRVVRDGREIVRLGERQVVGELSALDPEPRSAMVEAVEETEMFALANDQLEDLVAAHLAVSRGIIRMLVRRIRRTTAQA